MVLVQTYAYEYIKTGLKTYATSEAPDQHAHSNDLIWELHHMIFRKTGFQWLISGECNFQSRLRGCRKVLFRNIYRLSLEAHVSHKHWYETIHIRTRLNFLLMLNPVITAISWYIVLAISFNYHDRNHLLNYSMA